jgi:SAM-dependent methyltransferase
VSAFPVPIDAALIPRFAAAFDVEGKIVRGLNALGPIEAREVVVVDATDGPVRQSIAGLGARVLDAPLTAPLRFDLEDGSTDAVIGLWSAFRGPDAGDVAEVDRVLRPDGRLLVVLDYGRDDVSRILGDRPDYGAWTRRDGPFLRGGFRVRVLHCWWTFDSSEAATAFLTDAFGDAGASVAATLRRPRLSYNVAIYHRSKAA